MGSVVHLALVPRDGFFVKDGRGWHTSASGRGHGLGWPWPSTLLGALRSAWGREEEERRGRPFATKDWPEETASIHLGPSLPLRRTVGTTSWESSTRAWPVPSDAVHLGQQEYEPLKPSPVAPDVRTLGSEDDEAVEALWMANPTEKSKPRPTPEWWGDSRFLGWLAGDDLHENEGTGGQEFRMTRRVESHVGISPTSLTAVEGVLFSHDVVETLTREVEWAFGVQLSLPNEHAMRAAMVGADRRVARVEAVSPEVFALPDRVRTAFQRRSPGLRVITVTPTQFHDGWLPDGLICSGGEYRGHIQGLRHEVVLRAAMVGRPMHISGWDMVQSSPKATARVVPRGSVYFFERVDRQGFDEQDAAALWFAALGTRTNEGFGYVVPGVWDPGRES